MSDSGQPAGSVPAAWYPDPAGSPALRWWDGSRWTTELRSAEPESSPAQAPAVEIVLHPPGPPEPQRPSVAQPARPAEPVEKPYVPFQSTTSVVPPTIHGIAHTPTAWWIAFQPLWAVVTQVIVFALLNSFGSPPAWTQAVGFTVLNLAIVVVLVLLAFADRKALLAGGNGSAASPWWILLTPLAYLVARGSDVAKWEIGGWTPLVWWIIAVILAPGLAIAGYFAVLGLATP